MKYLLCIVLAILALSSCASPDYGFRQPHTGPVYVLLVNHHPDLLITDGPLRGVILTEGEKRYFYLPQGELFLRWDYRYLSTERRLRSGRANLLISPEVKTIHFEMRCPTRYRNCGYRNLRSIARTSKILFIGR